MSKAKKILGGEGSSSLMKIQLATNHAFKFRPEFAADIDAESQQKQLQKLQLWIQKLPVTNPPVYVAKLMGAVSRAEVLFHINVPQNNGAGFYYAKIAEAEPGTENVEPTAVYEFNFEAVSSISETGQTNLLASLENLPNELKDLKDVSVSLKAAEKPSTPDVALWKLIRATTGAMKFKQYAAFIDAICGTGEVDNEVNGNHAKLGNLARRRFLPFNDTDSYRTIKVLTEYFLLANCAVNITMDQLPGYAQEFGLDEAGKPLFTLPFLDVIRKRFPELPVKPKDIGDVLRVFTDEKGVTPSARSQMRTCYGVLQDKLTSPCFIELIWSYWHEEAMLAQAMKAISLRFQNKQNEDKVRRGEKDPLANMAIAPLLPLNNMMWGFVQDEQHRLSVPRRAYEYDHHYGITLRGKAVPTVVGADSRSNFLEAFHTLLHRCTSFYKQDDDLTVNADGFPLLNSLRELHFILSEGMHNQYGDLPFTARAEMLMQQWMLARPEFRQFLPTRTMIAYPEPWMGPLAAMNNLQGWTTNSPVNFNFLAEYGENLLLTVRFGDWQNPSLNAVHAANWAREWRSEVQGYMHAYRTVTGIDLTIANPQTGKIDTQQPSVHLQRRLKAAGNGNGNGVLAEF